MKIVIADYAGSMMPSHELEKQVLSAGLPDCQICTYPYHDDQRADFLQLVHDADALLTAFIKIDEEVLAAAPRLKVVSINATGYDNVDLAAARNLKAYLTDVDVHQQWRYDYAQPNRRLSNLTLGIFGLGKIGRAVATRAATLGMRVLAVDPFISQKNYAKVADQVQLVSTATLFQQADIISNHMNLNDSNYRFFTADRFKQMVKHPYFINMARGAEVDEPALVAALDNGQLKGAALDVLATEFPDLATNPLVGRENVLVTPHAAFYSSDSLTALQRISCQNIVEYLTGHPEKVFKLVVNPKEDSHDYSN